MGGQILHAISCNADYLLVGRLLGSTALGFYGMAWDLLRFVPDRLYKVAGRVTVPAFCRMQHEPEQLRRAYLSFLGYMSRLIVPPLACIAVAAPELLRQIYGPQWVAAALAAAHPEHRNNYDRSARGNGRGLLRAGTAGVRHVPARSSTRADRDRGDGHGVERIALGLRRRECGRSSVQRRRTVGRMPDAGRQSRESIARFDSGFTTAAGCAAATMAGRVLAANLGVSGLLELLLMIALPSNTWYRSRRT